MLAKKIELPQHFAKQITVEVFFEKKEKISVSSIENLKSHLYVYKALEGWAEFIGTNYALRNHPNGRKGSQWAGGLIRFDIALEREPWFLNNWIPTGIFNDLIDTRNTDLLENPWDRTGV